MNKTWHETNWSIPPWGTNPLDWVDRDLLTRDGRTLVIRQPPLRFVIWEGDKIVYQTDALSNVAAWLNRYEIGRAL